MRGSVLARVLASSICILLLLMTPAAAVGSEHKQVDESQLVPTLNPDFEPWDCKFKPDGPVCSGERHVDSGWVPLDIPCEDPLWIRSVENRYSTRYYDHDNLNYYRKGRVNDIEYLSTAPTGPATATLRTNDRYTQTFAVRGDPETITQVTRGVIWDLRPAQGPASFRAVGSLVEPFDGPATFSGRVTIDGVSMRYDEILLDDFLSEEQFLADLCQAATAGPRP